MVDEKLALGYCLLARLRLVCMINTSMRYERDMTDSVRAWMEGRGLSVRTECASQSGICDLVGVSFRKRSVRRRLALRQRSVIGSETDVSVLALLPDAEHSDGITPGEAADALGGVLSLGEIDATLAKLERRRFAERRGNRFAKLNGWMPLHLRIVAVELKLDRIDEVVQQAVNHTGFATESFIGLPTDVAERLVRSSRVQRVLDAGVGILSVGDSHVRVLRRSRPLIDNVIPWLQMHMIERFWRDAQRQFSISASAIDSG